MATLNIPLAERVRPQQLSDIIGQTHLLGKNAPISRMIAHNHLPSLILHGEAGIGKTTLARLLANAVGREFHLLSALDLTVKQLRELMDGSKITTNTLDFGSPVLFIDEIHRFNKAQQDVLLGAVESGKITLVGATTENPSFSINNALLSRCQVYRLESLTIDELVQVLQRALATDTFLKNFTVQGDLANIARLASGDARKALNLLEIACQYSDGFTLIIDDALLQNIAQTVLPRYDKAGDIHYDIISAFIKSVRGSDADASIYWLARMLSAGEDPAFIARRLVILASEDIGLANPNALLLADTALRSVQSIGMPEARIILAQATVYLATSPKSNSTYTAINEALAFVKNDNSPVPLHLRNGVTKLMKQLGYGVDYVYPHDYANHYYPQTYLPDNLIGKRFYYFADNQKEQSSFNFMNWLKGNHL
ncbi:MULTISPECIES: replication-associated recombination protein A [Moraxella]|uniref:replication-associated recombination protein A n=1 Tax=Moraxella TaxID=475 RepID=UPI001880FEA1|nr:MULTISPECIES: replication-associated recombination protein A [Moraxella]MBE9578440.1 replication-associated recombination protein A [Moraxella sp. K1664]MBE9587752.1 replication-associated recombination protein A [Moraxella sp. K1630]MBE9597039.1 replication-associated recombination protein A [Moraxella sp. K2450]MDH9218266.1 replication-associated recombination protein A [Moraxella lacunata]